MGGMSAFLSPFFDRSVGFIELNKFTEKLLDIFLVDQFSEVEVVDWDLLDKMEKRALFLDCTVL
jgi:hypothetical protein